MAFLNIGKKTQGKDFNFFQRVDVASSTFGNNPDIIIPFSNNGIMFLNEGTGVVEVSFNGNTVHTELNSADSSAGLVFDNRAVSLVWFRLKSGTPPISIRVEAW